MKPASGFLKLTVLTATAALAGGGLGWALRPSAGPAAGHASAKVLPRHDEPPGHPRMQTRTQERIEALRLAGSPSAQCLAVLAFAEIDSIAEIRDLLENARFFPPHAAETLAVQTLLRRWLELEPETAVEYCRAHYPQTLPDLLVNYAATHPAEAERLALAAPAGYWAELTWRRVCLGVAAKDPEAAWAMLQRTPKDAEHEAAKVAGKLATLDLAGAAARIEKLPDSIKGYAQGALALAMMDADPVSGWNWILRQPDPGFMIQQTIDHTLNRDPAKALQLLGSLSPGVLDEVKRAWSLQFNVNDAAGTAAALASSALDPALKKTLIPGFFSSTKYRDPEGSLVFLFQMDPETQLKTIPEFTGYWFSKSPDLARKWAISLPEGPLREAATSSLPASPESTSSPEQESLPTMLTSVLQFSLIQDNDPRLAKLTPAGVGEIMATVTAQTPDTFARALARQNPAAMTSWLETASLTPASGPSVAQFFMAWAAESPGEAAAWVGKLPDGDVARTAAVNVARQYLRYAPDSAQSWVDSLPAGPVQEAAQRGLKRP